MSHATPLQGQGAARHPHRLAIALLLTFLLAACGGGSVSAPALQDETTGEPALPVTGAPGGDSGEVIATTPVNKLVLTTPALAELAAGEEFEAVLSGEFVDEVYQGSCRLAYDPALLEPVTCGIGTFVPADMATLADTQQHGFVPFAFTGLPGDPGISAGSSGMLLTVRFRVLTASTEARVRFVSDTEFLQLRDRNSRRLSFDTATVMEAAR